jgi:hypothetical protein
MPHPVYTYLLYYTVYDLNKLQGSVRGSSDLDGAVNPERARATSALQISFLRNLTCAGNKVLDNK